MDTEPGSWLKARLWAAAHTAEAGSPQVAHFWLLSRALLLLSLSLLPSFSEAPLLGSGEYVLPSLCSILLLAAAILTSESVPPSLCFSFPGQLLRLTAGLPWGFSSKL